MRAICALIQSTYNFVRFTMYRIAFIVFLSNVLFPFELSILSSYKSFNHGPIIWQNRLRSLFWKFSVSVVWESLRPTSARCHDVTSWRTHYNKLNIAHLIKINQITGSILKKLSDCLIQENIELHPPYMNWTPGTVTWYLSLEELFHSHIDTWYQTALLSIKYTISYHSKFFKCQLNVRSYECHNIAVWLFYVLCSMLSLCDLENGSKNDGIAQAMLDNDFRTWFCICM